MSQPQLKDIITDFAPGTSGLEALVYMVKAVGVERVVETLNVITGGSIPTEPNPFQVEVNRLAGFVLHFFPEAITPDDLASRTGPVDVIIRLLAEQAVERRLKNVEPKKYRVTGLLGSEPGPIEVTATSHATAKMIAAQQVGGYWTEETEVVELGIPLPPAWGGP